MPVPASLPVACTNSPILQCGGRSGSGIAESLVFEVFRKKNAHIKKNSSYDRQNELSAKGYRIFRRYCLNLP